MNLTFGRLREVNAARCEARTFNHGLTDWSPTDFGCAVAGEVGELCNLVKKVRRGDSIPLLDIADEMADVVIYLDLLAARMGIDLGAAVVSKFDRVSSQKGSPHRLVCPNEARPFDVRVDDSGDTLSESRYLVLSEGDQPNGTLRMARRCLGSRALGIDQDMIEQCGDDHLENNPDGMFARWGESMVTVKPGGMEALAKWADEFLEVDAWELEAAMGRNAWRVQPQGLGEGMERSRRMTPVRLTITATPKSPQDSTFSRMAGLLESASPGSALRILALLVEDGSLAVIVRVGADAMDNFVPREVSDG